MSADRLVVEPISVTGQQSYGESVFPLALACRTPGVSLDDSVEWLKSQKQKLAEDLNHSGAILFRDFPLKTDRDFDAFIQAFDFPNFRYEDSLSNAVRVNRTERVFTANEAPPEVTIFFHHEMAQLRSIRGSCFSSASRRRQKEERLRFVDRTSCSTG